MPQKVEPPKSQNSHETKPSPHPPHDKIQPIVEPKIDFFFTHFQKRQISNTTTSHHPTSDPSNNLSPSAETCRLRKNPTFFAPRNLPPSAKPERKAPIDGPEP